MAKYQLKPELKFVLNKTASISCSFFVKFRLDEMFAEIVLVCSNEQSKKQKKINFNKKEKKVCKNS